MSLNKFIFLWLATIFISSGLNALLWYGTGESVIITISTMSILIFAFLSVVVYFAGEYMLKIANKQLYLGLVLGNMGFKMLMSVAMMLIIRSRVGSVCKTVFLSFLITYLAFTFFEAYFMLKQSDSKK